MSYCNAVCQRAHWKVHKKTCKARAAADTAKDLTAALAGDRSAQYNIDNCGSLPVALAVWHTASDTGTLSHTGTSYYSFDWLYPSSMKMLGPSPTGMASSDDVTVFLLGHNLECLTFFVFGVKFGPASDSHWPRRRACTGSLNLNFKFASGQATGNCLQSSCIV